MINLTDFGYTLSTGYVKIDRPVQHLGEATMNKITQSVYRIFLSSTAIDMQAHRQKASDSIMRLGDLPVQMETFGARPSDPVSVCRDRVRESDALVVMVAHRYGWVPQEEEGGDGKKSITWLEVETALETDIPVFAFLVDKDFGWEHPKEQDLLDQAADESEALKVYKTVQALKDFRTFLEGKAGLTRDTFTTPDDLAMKVATSLAAQVRETTAAPEKTLRKRTREFRVVHPLQPAPHFRGRQNLLKDLRQWWADPVHPDRVRSLMAIGGTGKTAVVEQFLKGINTNELRGSVLVWSFYEDPNTDTFLREANIVFAGEEGEGAGGRLARLERALSGSEPHLLVLDGLERVQSTGTAGHARGDLEDHRLKNLLRAIAGGLGRTRALITSRFKLTDLEQWEGAGYRSHQLDVLDKETAVSVLQAWQVQGDEAQLLALADAVGRHALSVSVLGSYLHHYCEGDPACAAEFDLDDIAPDEPQAARLNRILAGYAKSLPEAERDLLIRLSVFPNGVAVDVLGYIIDAGGDIAGALVGIGHLKLVRLAERLRQQGLIYTYQRGLTVTYTAHPFLREYFRQLLGVPAEDIHEVVRSQLAVGLEARPTTKPRDPEMLDRYEALIEHSIWAGHFKEAYDLFCNVMGGGGDDFHLYHTLGDYGRILRILSLFSENGDPQHLTIEIPVRDRGILLSGWGLAALELGDLGSAECCLSLYVEYSVEGKDWPELSIALQNQACIALFRGTFLSARELLNQSLEYADTNHVRRYSHGYLAASLHALGEISEAHLNFIKATEILGKPLFSVDGIYEAEHLFALGDHKKAYERTDANLATCEEIPLVRDIYLCHALLGLFSLPESIPEARDHLQKVRDWTEQSGHMEGIIKAHILAAEIAYCTGDFHTALDEATLGLNHAEGCGFGQFAIDLHLQLAKIYLAIPEPRTALQHAREALDRSQHPECQYAWGEANGLHLCGLAHSQLGEPELAKKRLIAAIEVRQRIQHPGVEETHRALESLK